MKNLKATKVLIATLLASTMLTACENAQDLARKPDVAAAMIEDSLARCETGLVNVRGEPYAEKLRFTLMQVRTKDLDLIKENKITICIDQRLASQNEAFTATQKNLPWWKRDATPREIEAVYYNQNRIIGLPDHSTTKSNRGAVALERFSEAVTVGRILPAKDFMYAATYSHGKYYSLDWKKAQDFDQASVNNNPQLKTAPLRIRPPN